MAKLKIDNITVTEDVRLDAVSELELFRCVGKWYLMASNRQAIHLQSGIPHVFLGNPMVALAHAGQLSIK